MVIVRFQLNQNIVAEKHLYEVPREGQTLCFYSYKADDLKIMNYKVFEVVDVGIFIKDPSPSEGFVNRNVGTDHYLVTIKPKDIQKVENDKSTPDIVSDELISDELLNDELTENK